jgi:hypothetical protein
MKNIYKFKFYIYFFGFLLLFGCKKDHPNPINTIASIEMKEWVSQYLKDSVTTGPEPTIFNKIQWENAHEINSDTVFYDVATINNVDTTKYIDASKGTKSFIVFKKRDGKIVSVQQYVLFGNLNNIITNSDKYIAGYGFEHNEKFTGIESIITIKGTYIESKYFESGLFVAKNKLQSTSDPKAIQSIKNKKTNGCIDWYLVYTDSYGYVIDEYFLFTSCSGDHCAQESIISRTGTQSIYINCGGGGGNNPPQAASTATVITQNIQDSCIKNMVKFAIKADIQYNIDQSMNSIFGSSTKYNLNIQDGKIVDPTTDGNATLLSSYSQTIWPGQTVTHADVQITLNRNTLPNASREYIAATIIHEAFHAFLDANPGWYSQHTDMAKKYLDQMTQDLLKMFPSMDPNDAKWLTWNGLQPYAGADYNDLSQVEKDLITITNDQYKTNMKGHSCSGI